MKTIKLNVGHLSTLEEVEHINEELQALLIPLLTAVENEAETDTHFMLRAVNRLVCAQGKYFTEGKDFYRLTGQDLELFKLCASIKRTHKYSPISDKAREVTLITESGYLLTVKPFNDPLSWQVQNQLIDAYFRLSEFPELQHINIPTLAELEAMPIGEAQNLISRLEADSYQGHGRRGSYAMNLRRKEKKALKPMVIAIEQASQLHIQDMGDYRS